MRTMASGLPSSPAMTSAVSVLPQPGGPQNKSLSLARNPWALRTSSRLSTNRDQNVCISDRFCGDSTTSSSPASGLTQRTVA